ncbi:hypothetical protein N9L94_07055, partial [Robiginitalea sp.]|nr:hypothetical protein [Robiginitalea sp.]
QTLSPMKLINFCYFLTFLAFVGCGEVKPSEKTADSTPSITDSKTSVVADSQHVFRKFAHRRIGGNA